MKYTLIAFIFSALLLAGCGGEPAGKPQAAADDHGHEHGDHAEESGGHAHEGGEEDHAEAATGPQGGRLLSHDGYALELKIVEAGTPPHFQAWLYRDGQPLPAQPGDAISVELQRLGGRRETHSLSLQDGRLRASSEVAEPHSFDVSLSARIAGKSLRWDYPSYEGRTRIGAAIARQAGIVTAPAAAGSIRDEHEVQGLITPVEGRHARVMARFPGPVREVRASVGDAVRAGQVLAVIESNVSLSNYSITAPFAGTVLARNTAVGDLAGEAPLFEIADLSRLWVDLHLFGADAQHITPGLPVEVIRLSDDVKAVTTLDRVLPGTATASQSTVARASIDNADGRWRTGAAVRARVTVSVLPVPLLVPLSALQKFRDWDAVFVRVGEVYEVRPLKLGARDALNVQVLDGLQPGDDVVVEQSYVIKADIEKSGAGHDH
jgi:membrane fusion protein, heavy metal efflux system